MNKTILRLEIPNPNANGNTSRWPDITSKCFDVGTKSKFSLRVFTLKGSGMLSAWLRNESDHDVVVDSSSSVGGGGSMSGKNAKIEKGSSIKIQTKPVEQHRNNRQDPTLSKRKTMKEKQNQAIKTV